MRKFLVRQPLLAAIALTALTILASTNASGALTAAHERGRVPVTGYDGKWKFNANDGTPTVTVSVSRAGTFAFRYTPSYCSGGFTMHGKFTSIRFHNVPYNALYVGQSGFLVSLTATGSCRGSQPGNRGNTFTWTKARGITGARWPNSRYVQGDMIQTACVSGGTCRPLDIDWGMVAA